MVVDPHLSVNFWISIRGLHNKSAERFTYLKMHLPSIADPDPNPDPDPTDPHVFGPPGSGSGSISQRYGSGSGSGYGSFSHQANIVRKTLIPTTM